MPDLRLRAMRMLSRREYARLELARKLAPYAVSGTELDALLDDLEKCHLLSDQRCASQRVAARAARLGNERLAEELRHRGIDEASVQLALAESGSEVERCRKVWEKKFGSYPAGPAERVKQERFLRYRGFSAETVRQILRGVEE